MATVIFYNFILLSSTFFVWASEKGRTKIDRWGLLFISFLLLFIPSAIRYDVGSDFISYIKIYENAWALESYKLKEPAFYFINWLLKKADAEPQWLFVVFAFLFTVIPFTAYNRNNAWVLHFMFFSILWFFSFTGIRQAVALSFCFISLFHFFDKNYLLFFCSVAVAALFHQSAVVIGIIGLIVIVVPLPIRLKKSLVPFVFISLIIFSYFLIGLLLYYIEKILGVIGLGSYSAYFSGRFFVARTDGTGFAALFKIMLSIYIIARTKEFLSINYSYWIMIALVFVYAISVVLAMNIEIFGRMSTMLVFVIPVALFLLTYLRNNNLHRLVIISFLTFFLLLFIKDGFGLASSIHDPNINPYKTIF